MISGNLTGAAQLSSQLGSDIPNAAPGLGMATAVENTNFVNLPAAAISAQGACVRMPWIRTTTWLGAGGLALIVAPAQ